MYHLFESVADDMLYSSYIGIPTFFIFFFGYKFWFRTKVIPPAAVDLFSGKREIDEEEERFIEEEKARGERSRWQRFFDEL